MTSILDSVISLRERALADLIQTDEFLALTERDRQVCLLTGARPVFDSSGSLRIQYDMEPTSNLAGKLTRGDLIVSILQSTERPLKLREIFDAANERDPKRLGSFRVTLSSDARFYSMRKGKDYLWWLSGFKVPQEWS